MISASSGFWMGHGAVPIYVVTASVRCTQRTDACHLLGQTSHDPRDRRIIPRIFEVLEGPLLAAGCTKGDSALPAVPTVPTVFVTGVTVVRYMAQLHKLIEFLVSSLGLKPSAPLHRPRFLHDRCLSLPRGVVVSRHLK